jgi:16S rRNA (cytosine1402-N4)-methyltransferase
MANRVHEPVMVEEVLAHLNAKPGDVVVDLTVGAGGHTDRILNVVGPTGRVIGLDRDVSALRTAAEVLKHFKDRVVLRESCSDQLIQVLRSLGVSEVQGVLMDLGVSSMQLDVPSRGFSFRSEGPLDMRMSAGKGKTALDLITELSTEELAQVLRDHGDEPSAVRIAERLKDLCRRRPPRTTLELANFVESLHPSRGKGRSSVHPATQTFQALRTAVNDEMGQLIRTLPLAEAALAPGGRLAVISFHSIEDRIVKNFFRDRAKVGAFSLLTKRPCTPTASEIRQNPRSRSAKLRAGEKLPLKEAS